MPEGWYPHEPGDSFYELDWVLLHEHPEVLRRHWEAAWRDGRVSVPPGHPGPTSGPWLFYSRSTSRWSRTENHKA